MNWMDLFVAIACLIAFVAVTLVVIWPLASLVNLLLPSNTIGVVCLILATALVSVLIVNADS